MVTSSSLYVSSLRSLALEETSCPCHEDSFGEVLIERDKLRPPANNHMSELGSECPFYPNPQLTAAPDDILTTTSWETLSRNHLAMPFLDS